MNSPCMLIPILVGLICALLGYLLGKSRSPINDNSSALQLELDNCKARSAKLSAELEALKTKSRGAEASHASVAGLLPPHVPFDADLASSIFGKKVKENDLKIVEGIGPKIEELFNNNGILTWEMLSETSVDRCNEILDKAGERFVVHNPTTWPRQAKLAHQGKWKELKDWQVALDAGKE